MNKYALLKGTLILTFAGLITRVMGFFYKIYLSNVMTPENLGLYQLVFPVYGLMFTLYGGGIQTAISQLIAGQKYNKKSILLKAGTLSLSIACFLSFFLFTKSDFVAGRILMEPKCSSALRMLSFLFPFCGITSCIQGYYFGIKRTGIPALSQLLEQAVRIFSVFFIALYFGKGDLHLTSELAVLGIVLGEVGASLFCLLSFRNKIFPLPSSKERRKILSPLLKLALPLTGTKLIVSLLHSLEAILIPFMLKAYGFSDVQALATYGILTGMTMPFLLFPSAITNAFAVLILPTVSQAQALGCYHKIKKTSELSIKYSLLLGFYASCIFFIFGKEFGLTFFHNKTAGEYMAILAWLCPFLYLSTTLNSILNGLGKAQVTFVNTVLSLGMRILFLCFLVPKSGLYGYLLGLLISQIVLTLFDYFSLYYYIPMEISAVNWMVKPATVLLAGSFLFSKLFLFLQQKSSIHQGLLLLFLSGSLGICYLIFLYIFHVITLKDFKSTLS
ncbi:MAG: polysaccharide biosynthesis protein [Acetivibrio sp.]